MSSKDSKKKKPESGSGKGKAEKNHRDGDGEKKEGLLKGDGASSERGNGSNSPSQGSAHNSQFELDLDVVLRGDETRASLMIRNIPNKYTQEMLLEAINKNHKGTYDFFYLPIDFKNKCNVGYAFINFIKVDSIVPFYQEFNARKWQKFNSSKICKITFARIQGKQNFIEHFRNSSLMHEDPKCRPLIFKSCGEDVGQEETFPGPNLIVTKTATGSGGITSGNGVSKSAELDVIGSRGSEKTLDNNSNPSNPQHFPN